MDNISLFTLLINKTMNVFYVNHNPEQAAIEHCSQHRPKMIVEYCQILSTAHRLLDNIEDSNEDYYKITHENHPSVVWARKSIHNYNWVLRCMLKLVAMSPFVVPEKLLKPLKQPPANIPLSSFSFPPVAAPSSFKELAKRNGVCHAYQSYLNYKFYVWKTRDYKQKIYVYFDKGRPKWYLTLKRPNQDWLEEVIEADRK